MINSISEDTSAVSILELLNTLSNMGDSYMDNSHSLFHTPVEPSASVYTLLPTLYERIAQ